VLAGEIAYTVRSSRRRRGDGYCVPKAKRIVVADRLEANARLAVLIHELGHALLRAEPEAEKLSYAQEELVVEAAIFSPRHGQSPGLAGRSVGDGCHRGTSSASWLARTWPGVVEQFDGDRQLERVGGEDQGGGARHRA
jgi:hypothetical protein